MALVLCVLATLIQLTFSMLMFRFYRTLAAFRFVNTKQNKTKSHAVKKGGLTHLHDVVYQAKTSPNYGSIKIHLVKPSSES